MVLRPHLTISCAQTKIRTWEYILRIIENVRWIKRVLNWVWLKVCGPKALSIKDIFKWCLSFFNIFLSVLFWFFSTGTRFQFYQVVFSFLEQVNVLQSILNLNGIPCLSVLNKFWNKVNESVKFCNFNESSFVKTVATTTKLEMTNLSDYTRWYFVWHLPLKYTSVCIYLHLYVSEDNVFPFCDLPWKSLFQ